MKTIIPLYSTGDYKSAKALKEDFNANKDFVLVEGMERIYVNKEDLKRKGINKVFARYKNNSCLICIKF